jgi:hypothetical protein
MKIWCNECDVVVDSPSFEENDAGESSPHNGVGEHTHCDNCQAILGLENVRDLVYITRRMSENKAKLDKYGAHPVDGRPIKAYPIEKLIGAQDEQKALLHAQTATFELQTEGKL